MNKGYLQNHQKGEKDHLLPIHDQSLRLTGTFKALGRMLGHSILHGGPGLHGLSPAAVHYLTTENELALEQPPPVTLNDVPDIELRGLISEVHVEFYNLNNVFTYSMVVSIL